MELPYHCFYFNPVENEVVVLKKNKSGFYPIQGGMDGMDHSKETADALNGKMGIHPAQREAMVVGSMFGWHVPGADPETHLK